jgi:penicillin amidase
LRILIRRTRNGPLVSDALAGGMEQPVALRWTALDASDTSYEAFFRANYAQDWRQLRESFRDYLAPALNILFVDRTGEIGLFGVGRIPVRATGQGRLPAPGWSDGYDWTGYIPFDSMPLRVNPREGYIASANDRNVDDAYPYFISSDFAPPDRARRIASLIELQVQAGEKLTVPYVRRMQADVVDVDARRLAQRLAKLPVSEPREHEMLEELQRWSGDMHPHSSPAALFAFWTRSLRERLFEPHLSMYWNKAQEGEQLRSIVQSTTSAQILRALTDSAFDWCGPRAKLAADACDDVLRTSLHDAIEELNKRVGPNSRDWRWQDVHTAVYAHTPFSSYRSLAPLFERRIGSGGSSSTISLASGLFEETEGFVQTLGSGFRQILAPESSGAWVHEYMNSTGQSGNPFSPHYSDMIVPFHEARYFEFTAPGKAGEASQVSFMAQPQ